MVFKRICGLLTAAVLITTAVLPVYAQSAHCDCGNDPVIIVNGMGNYPFVADAGTENEHQVFPPNDSNEIASLAVKVAPTILSGAAGDWSKFESLAIPAIYDMFKEFGCNPDGSSTYNVTTASFSDSMENYPDNVGGGSHEGGLVTTAVERSKPGHAYDYNYDWRMSPLDNADDLNALIQFAKQKSGHDKVDIICCSMGGIQTIGYIYKYGTNDIDSISFMSSTFTGVYMVGDLFTKNVDIDLKNVMDFANEEVNAGIDLSALYTFLTLAGVGGLTQDVVDSLLENELDNVYDEILIPIFGYMGGLWALCQDDKYEEAKSLMLKNADKSFIESIDDFHYNALNKVDKLLNNAQKSGVKIYVFSHYDYYAIPLYDRADENSDGMLETECTSGGATCAKHNSVLPASYSPKYTVCKNKNHKHISPDNIVDATSCLFPEYTWFIKDLYHVSIERGTEYEDLLWKLVFSDTQLNVNTFSEYPQFMMADKSENLYPTLSLHDLNGDGKVSTIDARLALRGATGIQTLKYNQLYALRYDKTGEVSTNDARTILRQAVGLR